MLLIKTRLDGEMAEILRKRDIPVLMDYLARGKNDQEQGNPTAVVHPSSTAGSLQTNDKRPAFLVKLENELREKMQGHVRFQGEGQPYLYNLNQIAYIMEGSDTDNKKKVSRTRVARAMSEIGISPIMIPSDTPGGTG